MVVLGEVWVVKGAGNSVSPWRRSRTPGSGSRASWRPIHGGRRFRGRLVAGKAEFVRLVVKAAHVCGWFGRPIKAGEVPPVD